MLLLAIVLCAARISGMVHLGARVFPSLKKYFVDFSLFRKNFRRLSLNFASMSFSSSLSTLDLRDWYVSKSLCVLFALKMSESALDCALYVFARLRAVNLRCVMQTWRASASKCASQKIKRYDGDCERALAFSLAEDHVCFRMLTQYSSLSVWLSKIHLPGPSGVEEGARVALRVRWSRKGCGEVVREVKMCAIWGDA